MCSQTLVDEFSVQEKRFVTNQRAPGNLVDDDLVVTSIKKK